MTWMKIVSAIIITAGYAGSTVLFEDNFNTKSNWSKMFGTCTESLSGGELVVENTGNNLSVYKNNGDYSTFTYKLKINAQTDHEWLGVTFCLKTTLDTVDNKVYSIVNGYMFTVRNSGNSMFNKTYSLYKLVRMGNSFGPEFVISGSNSFINNRNNELKVSKNGGRIDLFVNDVWVDSVTDASPYSGGAVGFVTGNGEKAGFDFAEVTDEYLPGEPHKYFSTDFNSGNLDGWRSYFDTSRVIEAPSGAMRINAGTGTNSSIIITNGSYRNAPVKVTVDRKGVDSDSGFYGIIYMHTFTETDSNKVSYNYFDAFVFKINKYREYAAYKYSTQSQITYSVLGPDSSINGTVDTLMVTADYKFVVNGDTLPNIDFDTLNFDFNAVGFIVDGAVTVEYDDFTAGNKPDVPVAQFPKDWKPYNPQNPAFQLGGAGLIYDLRGRLVGRYNEKNESLRGAGTGTFYVIPQNGDKNAIIRAIIK